MEKFISLVTIESIGVIAFRLFLFYGIVYLSSKIIVGLIVNGIKRNKKISQERSETLSSLIADLFRYIFTIIILIGTLIIFGLNTQSLVTFLSAITVVLGIAGKELIMDIINGIFNIYEGYYDVGDYIKVETYEGHVVACGIKSTTIITVNNETIILPNSFVKQIINYTKNDYISFFEFNVSYDVEISEIDKIINDKFLPIVSENKNILEVEYKGVQKLSESGITLRIQLTCVASERFEIKRMLNREIFKLLKKENIEIPYNQLTVHSK